MHHFILELSNLLTSYEEIPEINIRDIQLLAFPYPVIKISQLSTALLRNNTRSYDNSINNLAQKKAIVPQSVNTFLRHLTNMKT